MSRSIAAAVRTIFSEMLTNDLRKIEHQLDLLFVISDVYLNVFLLMNKIFLNFDVASLGTHDLSTMVISNFWII